MSLVVVEVLFPVKGKETELLHALKKLAQIAGRALGCEQYDVFIPAEGTEGIMVLMRFDSEKNLQKHEESDYISGFVKENEGETYENFAYSKWKSL